MTRHLQYIVVETGRCEHCHRDAGDHSLEGLCRPGGTPHLRHADVPEPCYRGQKQFAFVDLDNRYAQTGPELVA